MASPCAVSSRRSDNADTIAKIEKTFEDIVDSLLQEEPMSIPLRFKRPTSTPSSQADAEPSTQFTHVFFPARTSQEARRFSNAVIARIQATAELIVPSAILVRILELIHEALYDNIVVSKRNIYYKDPALFKSQAVVDRYVDILAYTYGVQRAALNVTAVAKGLVAGDFFLTRPDGTIAHQSPDLPHIVDDTNDIQATEIRGVSWILVIEKESTFRILASSKLYQTSRAGKGIILTAKGYPDISTRSFLRLLSTSQSPHTPPALIFALADFDPDGIAIMSTYKHGSQNLSHENINLNVPTIQWMGARSCDVLGMLESNGLLRLSGRDRKKATKMLENNPVIEENGEEPEWRRELQIMLMLNMKAEMEILAEGEQGVVGWVDAKLVAGAGRKQALD